MLSRLSFCGTGDQWAHVQVIADIDGDGVKEMVVAASYFYDRE